MHLSQERTDAKLEALRQSEGFDTLEDMLQATVFDSVSPGICIECDYTTEVEPDQDRGWCVLAGII